MWKDSLQPMAAEATQARVMELEKVTSFNFMSTQYEATKSIFSTICQMALNAFMKPIL